MFKLDQKGAIQFIVPLILLGGIIVGVYLVTAGPLKLFPRAVSHPISGPAYQRVFVTSTQYNGNLGGLAGADAKCQERANAAGLGGSWKAWLSTGLTSPFSRLRGGGIVGQFNGPFKLLNGTTIANDWFDLTDGTLQNPINIDEFGSARNVAVWTNTNTAGGPKVTDQYSTCSEWTTSGYNNPIGWVGLSPRTDYSWTETSPENCISQYAALYCFEQTTVSSQPISAPITPVPSPSYVPTPTITPTPTTRVIKQFRVAESPAELQDAPWQDYTEGMELSYIFKDASPGVKFIFIQFKDDQGDIVKSNGQDYITASIELIEQIITPVPVQTQVPAPAGSVQGPSIPWPFSLFVPTPQPVPTTEVIPTVNCTTSCGINNGLNCTNQNKANTECADYYQDNSYCDFQNPGPRGDGCISQTPDLSEDCTTSCGQNNGLNCTDQNKANTECADYYQDNSICNFTDPGERGDGCIPQ